MFLTFLFVTIAGFANGIMDRAALPELFDNSWLYRYRGPWLNNKLATWRNKYRLGDPKHGELFPGSTTLFVWTTDLWHCAQMIMWTALQAAISIHIPLIVWGSYPFLANVGEVVLLKVATNAAFLISYNMKNSPTRARFSLKVILQLAAPIVISFIVLIFFGDALNQHDPNFTPEGKGLYYGDWAVIVLFALAGGLTTYKVLS